MPDFSTLLERNIFTLTVERLGHEWTAFEFRMDDHIRARMAMGFTRTQVLQELFDDLNGGQGVFQQLLNGTKYQADFGLNGSYQVAGNELLDAEAVVWTLDPFAEHCDACLHQASLGARSLDDTPMPGFQPNHGKRNCTQYCKCTLEPAGGDE